MTYKPNITNKNGLKSKIHNPREQNQSKTNKLNSRTIQPDESEVVESMNGV